MNNQSANIEYMFFVRSALQFRQDLADISKKLNLPSPEEIIAVSGYVDSIKEKIEYIENKFADKFLEG